MTLLAKRNGTPFPSLVNEFLDSDDFFAPDLFNFNRNLLKWGSAVTIPSVNITENEKSFRIELAAPGLNKNDFKIELDDDGLLSISAEKKEEKKEEEKNYTRREFSYNSFSRCFQIPENAMPGHVDASYEDGVLTLTLPKKEVTAQKTKKEIQVR